jgi:hypothetical protein
VNTFACGRTQDGPSFAFDRNPSSVTHVVKIEVREAAGDPRTGRRAFEAAS